MNVDILKVKPPKLYEKGYIKYEEGLDIQPNWPKLMKHGYTFEEHLKLSKIFAIEGAKYTLKEAIEDNEISKDEIKEVEDLIERLIKEYNEM